MTDRCLDVLQYTQSGFGWGPVTALARLAAHVGGGSHTQTPVSARVSKPNQVVGALLGIPRRFTARGRSLLVICPVPGAIGDLAAAWRLRLNYDHVSVWVIDSFWTERIPAILRFPGLVDQVYVTTAEDAHAWTGRSTVPIGVLPWGADVLAATLEAEDKHIDVVRVGRQPAAWDKDEETGQVAAAKGLSFVPRPPFGDSESTAHGAVMAAYRSSRVVLASGNSVAAAEYTHPTRDYVTGRWTDALAHGCLVAGTPPSCPEEQTLLFDPALIRVPPKDLEGGMEIIKGRLEDNQTRRLIIATRRFAATHLDWRLRLRIVLKNAGVDDTNNQSELSHLGELIQAMESDGGGPCA